MFASGASTAFILHGVYHITSSNKLVINTVTGKTVSGLRKLLQFPESLAAS
jgi:hypothetical protein